MLDDRNYLYIGGEWVAPASRACIRVLNAATEEPIGEVPEAAVADVDRAVAAARHALLPVGVAPCRRSAPRCSTALPPHSRSTLLISPTRGLAVNLGQRR
jgi:hypothetical protein